MLGEEEEEEEGQQQRGGGRTFLQQPRGTREDLKNAVRDRSPCREISPGAKKPLGGPEAIASSWAARRFSWGEA